MKRKEFIKKSAGAVAAITTIGLLKSAAQSDGSEKEEDKKWTFHFNKTVKLQGDDYSLSYYFYIAKSALDCDVDYLDLNVNLNSPITTKSRYGVYRTEVRKCKDLGSSSVLMKCCPYEWVKGDGILDEDEFEFFLEGFSYIELVVPSDEKGKAYIEIKDKKKNYVKKIEEFVPVEAPINTSCFLTTVCLKHKGLQYDCDELKAMEKLHNYVEPQEGGRFLISEYYRVAPMVTAQIKVSPKREVILEDMFQNLVTPTKEMVERGLLEEAKAYYKDYTVALVEACGLK